MALSLPEQKLKIAWEASKEAPKSNSMLPAIPSAVSKDSGTKPIDPYNVIHAQVVKGQQQKDILS
eukprot:gene8299-1571_t